MGRSRYKIYEPIHPHFVTCTILNWLPKKDRTYQIWQEGYQPKLIQTDGMMINKINYIHHNPRCLLNSSP